MVKSHKAKKMQEIKIVDEVICNCCGQPIKKDEWNNSHFYDHIHISKNWGYFSNHDGETHKLDICEECCEKLLETFKIKPEITEYM